MMWRLFNNQFLFFWHIIRTRFLFWLIFISLIILSTQITGNPHLTVFSLFFDGVSYATVETHRVTLPILWFAYFFVPLLILLNSFQQLWRTRTLHLRGLQISPRRFSKVNLLLIALVTTVYDVLLITVMLITSTTVYSAELHVGNWNGALAVGGLFCITWLGVFLLLLLQAIGNRFNPPLALIIPASILIMTAYTAFRRNPLSYLMLTRITETNAWCPILILLSITILTGLGYLVIERSLNLN